jgi:hypothetical protein
MSASGFPAEEVRRSARAVAQTLRDAAVELPALRAQVRFLLA